jgi:predicted phosphodiesterase
MTLRLGFSAMFAVGIFFGAVASGQPLLSYADNQLRMLWSAPERFNSDARAIFTKDAIALEKVKVDTTSSIHSVVIPSEFASHPENVRIQLPGRQPLTFQGMPGPDNSAVARFTTISDTHSGAENYRGSWTRIPLIEDVSTDFFVHAGDVVDRPNGCAGLIRFASYAAGPLDRRPILFARGNHDLYVRGKGSAKVRKHSPLLFGRDQGNHVVHTGPVDLIVLDSNFVPQYNSILEETIQRRVKFLTTALEESKAKWKVVVLHHPPFPMTKKSEEKTLTLGPLSENSRILQEIFVPIFEQEKVDVVISGHNHIYHQQILNYVNYVGMGTLSGKLKDVDRWTRAGHAVHDLRRTVTQFTFGPDLYSWRTETLRGELIQEASIPR